MYFQSPQPMWFFFSYHKKGRVDTNPERFTFEETLERPYVYGPMTVLKSHGMHPKDFKVQPFCPLLKEIRNLLIEKIKAEGKYTDDVSFNHLEIKLYCRRDIFCSPERGEPFKNKHGESILQEHANTVLGVHNNINYNISGQQAKKDTVKGGTPIVTISVGNKRELIFHMKFKQVNGKEWEKQKSKRKVTFELNHGDVFVLDSKDEKPKLINGMTYFKTQHEAKFKDQNGVSIAMVFCMLKSTSKSLFDSSNDKWLWKNYSDFKDKVSGMIAS